MKFLKYEINKRPIYFLQIRILLSFQECIDYALVSIMPFNLFWTTEKHKRENLPPISTIVSHLVKYQVADRPIIIKYKKNGKKVRFTNYKVFMKMVIN